MEFNDPVVSGTVLIRPAIQSPDYVAGVSGWSVNVDGTVEFNSGQFRGAVLLSGVNGSYLQLRSDFGVPRILLRPGDIPGVPSISPGQIDSANGADGRPFVQLSAPQRSDFAADRAFIQLYGTGDPGELREVALNADVTSVSAALHLANAPITYDGDAIVVLTDSQIGRMSGAPVLANAASALLTGTDLTISAPVTGCQFEAWATVDMQHTTAGVDTAICELIVDGAFVAGQVVFAGNANTAGLRATIAQSWGPTVMAAAGNHTFQLRLTKAGGTDGHITVQPSHTSLKVQLYKAT